MLIEFDRLRARSNEIRFEENAADEVVGRIIQSLDTSFITPIDREDIHTLAASLDDVLDNMEETAHRFEVVRIDKPTPEAIAMARIIQECCLHLEQAIRLCRNMKNACTVQNHLKEIGRLENEADKIYRDADSDLFANPSDLLMLIKWRELYRLAGRDRGCLQGHVSDHLRDCHQGVLSMDYFDPVIRNFHTVDYHQLTFTVWLLIALALLFDFLNGFHDAANSVATVVSTRVLSPHMAVIWAAFFNFVAFLVFHLSVAATMGKGIIDPSIVDNRVIAATLVAACAWDILTWHWGLPTSSSHALIGGMIGAALVKALSHSTFTNPLLWYGIGSTVLFILLAPLIGMVTGLGITVLINWLFRRATPRQVEGVFRRGQLLSASLYSLGHGGNDAQKTMGIIFLLLLTASRVDPGMWTPEYEIKDKVLKQLHQHEVPDRVLSELNTIKDRKTKGKEQFLDVLKGRLSTVDMESYQEPILQAV